MKRKLTVISILLVVLVVVGCSVTNRSHEFEKVNIIVLSKLDTEINVDVNKKLTGKSSGNFIFGFIRIPNNRKYADGYGGLGSITRIMKSEAAYDAIKDTDADVLISPQYKIHKKTGFLLLYTKYEVEVSGYPGKFASFKNVPLDAGYIKVNN